VDHYPVRLPPATMAHAGVQFFYYAVAGCLLRYTHCILPYGVSRPGCSLVIEKFLGYTFILFDTFTLPLEDTRYRLHTHTHIYFIWLRYLLLRTVYVRCTLRYIYGLHYLWFTHAYVCFVAFYTLLLPSHLVATHVVHTGLVTHTYLLHTRFIFTDYTPRLLHTTFSRHCSLGLFCTHALHTHHTHPFAVTHTHLHILPHGLRLYIRYVLHLRLRYICVGTLRFICVLLHLVGLRFTLRFPVVVTLLFGHYSCTFIAWTLHISIYLPTLLFCAFI